VLNRNEILETALEDIARIAASDVSEAQRIQLIINIAQNSRS
jgi:hypothetical protein